MTVYIVVNKDRQFLAGFGTFLAALKYISSCEHRDNLHVITVGVTR